MQQGSQKQSDVPHEVDHAVLTEYFRSIRIKHVEKSLRHRIIRTTIDTALGGQLLFLPVRWVGKHLAETLLDYAYPLQSPAAAVQPVQSAPTDLSASINLEDSVVLVPRQPSEPHPSEQAYWVQQSPTFWQTATNFLHHTAQSISDYLTGVTPKDVTQMTVKTIGSAAGAGAFVLVAGPPGLMALPAYWFVEGSTKSFAAFVSTWWSQQVFGEVSEVPLFELWQSHQKTLKPAKSTADTKAPTVTFLVHAHSPAILGEIDLRQFIIEDYQPNLYLRQGPTTNHHSEPDLCDEMTEMSLDGSAQAVRKKPGFC